MKKIILVMAALITHFAWSNDIGQEIQSLDDKYRNFMEYPILIFNKQEIIEKLSGDQESDIQIVKEEVLKKYSLAISDNDADDILTYHTKLNGSATSLRFKNSGFCAVFPAQIENNRDAEVKRLLGISNQYNPYPQYIIEKAKSIVTLEELQLMSLYHELAHCLDDNYIPKNEYTNSHSIHLAEAYAESLGLMLLQQKYNFSNLFLRRAALRAVYAKYFGKLLLTDPSIMVFEEYEREMGIAYDLSTVLLAAQDLNIRKKSIHELKQLAFTIVEGNSTPSRTISAIRFYLENDKEKALEKYHDYALSSPDLFFRTYLNLSHKIDFYEKELDLLLESI